ncbi:MarR family winged helix-turn-helix transcriptional regulator [Luteimonas sp. S4-F44]|uniref:MarR family winged helix-turn-helix transcriptional regulator n=1 Tax=Luteimonas sp. S4-F44 TaxID=2925842 RepID=UPI001F53D711|nr:MarR family winged helix-turn-helix transcriptional regulator [Luteimonas sp. S4-F44]UNK41950.1 MarR family winged helix-turn-helix transcriptional regulator [Luteimonas sp. S4-F44]
MTQSVSPVAEDGQVPQAPEHATLDLETFLPYRLSVLTNHISRGLADIYSERFGIGVTEWRVIAVLGRDRGLSANEVAERTAMDKVAVSRAVARLLERALLLRGMHDSDRRRSVLALSPAGEAVYDVVAPLALDYQQRVMAPLDADERATLLRLMDKLEASLAG